MNADIQPTGAGRDKDGGNDRDGVPVSEAERRQRSMPASSYPSKEGDVHHRATRTDGNPNPVPSTDDPSGLKPQDDTPSVLERKEGPRT